MSSDIAIKVENLSKCYQIYEQPHDRLKQFVLPRLRRPAGLPPKQYYREFWALKDVSFEVKKGETIGIIGRNGSGKSTLLQMICGTLHPSSGNITTHGRIAALLELGAGFNPDFSGRENVFLNASIFGLTRVQIEQKFEEIAAFADIGEFIEQPVKTYSSGMYARLAFAVATSLDPEVLIVDEILSVGDAFFQARCMRRLEEFRERGGTVFFVTHDTYSVERICMRAIVLEKGRKVFEGATANAVNIYYKMSREDLPVEVQSVPTEHAVVEEQTENDLPLPTAEPIPVRRDHVVDDGTAYIDQVYVLNAHGDTSLNYLVGDWVTVKLDAYFLSDYDQLDFGVGIRDRTGTLIGGAHTFYSGHSFGPVRAGERLILTARIKAELIPGEYLLIAGLAQHDSLQNYRECYGLYNFAAISITGNREFWGAVRLPTEIETTKAVPGTYPSPKDAQAFSTTK